MGALLGSGDAVLKTVLAPSVLCAMCKHDLENEVTCFRQNRPEYVTSHLFAGFPHRRWCFDLLFCWSHDVVTRLDVILSPSGAVSSTVPLTWGDG